LTAPAFQRAVLGALAAVEGLEVVAARPFVLQLAYSGARYTVRLDEHFKRHRHGEMDPGAAAEQVQAALGVPGAAALRDGPYPRLLRREALPEGAPSRPCPFDEELAEVLVWRLPLGHVPLGADELAAWRPGQDPWTLARENLRERTERIGASGGGEGAGLVVRYHAGDGLDAAAVLLDDLLRAMAGWVSGRLHVAIPTRDDLLAFGDADRDLAGNVAAAVAEAFAASPDRLSPRVYALADDGRLIAAADGGVDASPWD